MFDEKNNPLGYVDIPLFKGKNTLNVGYFTENIEDAELNDA